MREDYKPEFLEAGRNDNFYWEVDIKENTVYIWIESGGEWFNLDITKNKSVLQAKVETKDGIINL